MTLTIREATLNDLDLLVAMNQQLDQDENDVQPLTPARMTERMQGWITHEGYTVLLISDETDVVGYMVYHPLRDHWRSYLKLIVTTQVGEKNILRIWIVA